jgi:DNA-binding transcriptional LysR family regulator
MDRLEAMSVLVAAADAGSLSAAARRLGMPLATVSRRVSDLEAHVGARLLRRSSRRLSLTDAGEAYLVSARRILDQVEEAERRAAGEHLAPRGGLVLTAPLVFGRLHVLPIVTDFLAAYPEIDIRLTLSDRNASLPDDHIDIAVRIGALADSSLLAARVGDMRRILAASPAFLAQHKRPKSPADLARLPCIDFDAPSVLRAWAFPGQRAPVDIRARLTVNTAEAAVDAAIAGAGVARVLHYQAEAALRSGALELLLAEFEPEPAPVSLVRMADASPALKIRAFMEFAAPRLRARLAELSKLRRPSPQSRRPRRSIPRGRSA